MPCCGSCADGGSCESGMNLKSLYIAAGFASPGLVIGDLMGWGLPLSLGVGLAFAALFGRRGYEKLHADGLTWITPHSLLFGTVTYFVFKRSSIGISNTSALLVFFLGTWAWSNFSRPDNLPIVRDDVPNRYRLGAKEQFGMGPHKNYWGNYYREHDIRIKY